MEHDIEATKDLLDNLSLTRFNKQFKDLCGSRQETIKTIAVMLIKEYPVLEGGTTYDTGKIQAA